jgi:Ca2+-binding RTX toxin-like protein
VQAGDTSADLDVTSSSALTLNGGTIKDAAGNNATLTLPAPGAAGSLGANAALVIDGVAPTSTATVTAITDNVGSVQGTIASGATTDDTSLSISGTLTAALVTGETVRIYDGSTFLGTATISGTTWSYVDSRTLTNNQGVSYTARVADAAGNQSAAGTAYTATVDLTAPTGSFSSTINTDSGATTTISSGGLSKDNTLGLSGTYADANGVSTVEIYDGATKLGDATLSSGTWSFTTAALLDGLHSFTAKVIDNAGNTLTTSPAVTATVDATAPTTTAAVTAITDNVGSVQGTIASGATTDDTSLSISGTLTAALVTGETVRIYDGSTFLGTATISGTTWSYVDSRTLTNNQSVSYIAQVADAAGNQSAAGTAYTATVDLTAPTVDLSGFRNPAFAGSSIGFGLPAVGRYASPAFADIDGDGDLDAFIGEFFGNTLFFRNTGSATSPAFAGSSISFGLPDVGSSASPAFADIDGDGDLDAFIGEFFGNTLFFRNTGSANSAAFAGSSIGFGLPAVGRYASPAFADIDGDGDLDAFIGNGLGDTLFFRNTGSATNPAFAGSSIGFGLPAVGSYASPALADIDGDGDLDAFIGNRDGSTLFFRNTGSANSPAFAGSSIGFGLPAVGLSASPAFADIDGDGDLDAFIGNRDGSTLFFRNTGSGGLTATNPNGSYAQGSTITIEVPFSEVVFVNTAGGTPTLLLETGSTDRSATYLSGSGTKVLTFSYTVQAGDSSADLDLTSSSALALNGGTIQDAAGNNATLTLPAPGAAGSLGANAALVVDGAAPVITAGPTPTGLSGISVTSNENGSAALFKADNSQLFLTALAANTPATLTLAAQATVTTATLKVADAAGNLTSATPGFVLGTTGADVINGSATADFLYGFSGNDRLTGGGGNDTLAGGAGNDSYLFDTDLALGSDTLDEAGGGSDTLNFSATTTRAIALNLGQATSQVLNANLSLTLGSAATVENVIGGSLADTITGNSLNNSLTGGGGNDTLAGGAGNDSYLFDSDVALGSDTLNETGGGIDTLNFAATTTRAIALNLGLATAQVVNANLSLTLGSATTFENAIGGALADTLTGNSLVNSLTGGGGNDTLDGGAGIDTLTGGDGNDTYTIETAGDLVVETNADPATGGIDTVLSSLAAYTLTANVENLTLTGVAAINGSGNSLNNVILGNAAANSLDGGTGIDTLTGGDGNDTYTIETAGDLVVETNADLATGGIDTVLSLLAAYTLTANVENLTLTGVAAINCSGNSLNNVILGNAAANSLDGGTGIDTLTGGDGNDTYTIETAGDLVVETNADLATGGIDTVLSLLAAYTLTANVENLTLTGVAAINGSGNSLNNVILGNAAANSLTGGGGNDTLNGGAGNDSYLFDADEALGSDTLNEAGGGIDTLNFAATSTRSIALNLGLATAQVVNDRLSLNLGSGATFENVRGGALADTITGNSLNNSLTGGGGNDTLVGGAGNDSYLFDTDLALGSDSLDEAGGGSDTLNFSATTTRAIALNLGLATAQVVNANLNLTLGSAATFENVIGGALADTITGNGLVNSLTGGGGNDTLAGAAGNDSYLFDSDVALGSDTLNEAGGGIDSLSFAATTTRSIALNLGVATAQVVNANLSLTLGSATTFENAIGGALADTLTGNGLFNSLTGGGGNDTLIGGAGNDSYLFDSDLVLGSDTLDETGGGSDTLNFATTTTRSIALNLGAATVQVVNANLSLTLGSAATFENAIGGSLADTLTGSSLNNSLTGGGGNDTLAGGAGNDSYLFDTDLALGSDTLDEAGGGSDTLNFSATTTRAIALNLGVATAQVVNANLSLTLGSAATVENVIGGSLADTLTGNSLNNSLTGGGGNDTLAGGAGNDSYLFDTDLALGSDTLNEAGGGSDTLNFSATTTRAIALNLGQATAQVVNANLSLTLGSAATVENVIGGSLADTITGNSLNNSLTGGGGNDTLVGGLGADRFRFATALNAATNNDVITDFSIAQGDRIELENTIFTALPTTGPLAASAFRIGTAATDGNQRILYDNATGVLAYDSDGIGATAAIAFATITPGLALTITSSSFSVT